MENVFETGNPTVELVQYHMANGVQESGREPRKKVEE